MPHILPASANETISKETEDFSPVCYNAFARPAQSADTLQNTDLRRRFVVSEHYQSAVLFFTIYGWKHVDIFL